MYILWDSIVLCTMYELQTVNVWLHKYTSVLPCNVGTYIYIH